MSSRRAFTLEEKIQICSRIKNGEKNRELCKEYGVSSSTVSTIWKHRDKWFNERKCVSQVIRKFVRHYIRIWMKLYFNGSNNIVLPMYTFLLIDQFSCRKLMTSQNYRK